MIYSAPGIAGAKIAYKAHYDNFHAAIRIGKFHGMI